MRHHVFSYRTHVTRRVPKWFSSASCQAGLACASTATTRSSTDHFVGTFPLAAMVPTTDIAPQRDTWAVAPTLLERRRHRRVELERDGRRSSVYIHGGGGRS